MRIKFKSEYLYLLLFFCANTVSLIISSNKQDAFSSFLSYVSGPIIFFFIANMNISNTEYMKFRRGIKFLFLFFIFSALLIYPIQEQFYNKVLDFSDNYFRLNFYVWNNDGSMSGAMRMGGLCIHPTVMGSIIFFYCVYLFYFGKKKSLIFYPVVYYLTRTRSILFGLLFYFILRANLLIKLILLGIILIFSYMTWTIIMNWGLTYLDPSALRHLADFFVTGPAHIVSNLSLFGLGHGTISPFSSIENYSYHVESDLYIALLQIGLFGILLYLLVVTKISRRLMKLIRGKSVYQKHAQYLLIIFIALNIGCLVFSYYAVRFVSNYVWIELGFFYGFYFNRRRVLKTSRSRVSSMLCMPKRVKYFNPIG